MTDDASPRDSSADELADRPVFRAVLDEVRDRLAADSTGHDVAHARRVFRLGVRLARAEGADPEVVGAAALTHDLHRVMGDGVHPEESLPAVEAVLEGAGFPHEKIPDVLHCVEVHDEYEFRSDPRPAESLEAEVLQDADNLDAIGAVGIARSFAFTGAHGHPLWRPDGDDPSGLAHFHEKLLRLEAEMNTETARELAAERHRFTEAFVDRFEREWHGRE